MSPDLPPGWDDDGSCCPWCERRGCTCAAEILARPPAYVVTPDRAGLGPR